MYISQSPTNTIFCSHVSPVQYFQSFFHKGILFNFSFSDINLRIKAGPCILGATVNKMLNRHPQTSFHVGDLNLLSEHVSDAPGRVVILEGNKNDMGAFRFTYTKKNLIIATTDMPNFDDRPTNEKNIPSNHYSKIKKRGQVYGLKGLYRNNKVSHENIRVVLA